MNAALEIDWMIVGVLLGSVVIWTAWEMLQAWRQRREIRRLMQETKGDGLP